VGKIVVSGLKNDASDGRNADAAGEEHSGNACIAVERERAVRSVQREFRARLHDFQIALERGVAHPCRKHKIVFVGSARQGKPACVPFRIGFRRGNESVVRELARFAGKSLRLFEVKGHCPSRDFLAAFQLDFVDRHDVNFLPSAISGRQGASRNTFVSGA